MDEERDDLEKQVAERTARNPEYPQMLEAAERARRLVRELGEARKAASLSQDEVARRMGTSQPAVARLERGERDPRLSTIVRYAHMVGMVVTLVETP